MAKQIVPLLVITLLTGVVWLFAEVESLGEDRPNMRLRFESVGEPPDLLVRAQDFDGAVSLVIRGSRGSIRRARAVLDNAVVLVPGDPGVPNTDGLHTVRLREALLEYPPLANTGVIIESVRPQRVEIRVSSLVETEIPIAPDLEGLVTEGEVQVTPPVARVRAPSELVPGLEDASIVARVDPGAVGPEPGPRTQSVSLALPDAIAEQAGVALLTSRATVSFSLRSTIEEREFPAVPVQLLLSPTEAREWEINIDPRQQLIPVRLTGPGEALAELEESGARLVAALALSEIELSRGITEKPIRLIVLRDNLAGPLPEGVAPATSLPMIGFTSRRLSEEETPG